MVEAFNAAATDGAMATTTCSYRLAVGTQLRAIDVLQHVEEVDIVILQISRLRTGGQKEEEGTKHRDTQVKVYGPSAQVYTQMCQAALIEI